ncbi:hypothetical protein LTR93_011791 [Exophiala xenobiotica]|nr:hypothetical protein LTR93_011791 [Exophiala xenobiotica]
MPSSRHQAPVPGIGPPFVPSSLTVHPKSKGYSLNHVALQVSSIDQAFLFYVDFLGLSLAFAVNTGPFTAYYLGYAQEGVDTSPADLAGSTSTRTGFLELIFSHDDEATGNEGPRQGPTVAVNGPTQTSSKQRFGFAHLGFRVPDVDEALKRATEKGFNVIKPFGDADVSHVRFPNWEAGYGSRKRSHPFFQNALAGIGFIEDPDGNVIELLPPDL